MDDRGITVSRRFLALFGFVLCCVFPGCAQNAAPPTLAAPTAQTLQPTAEKPAFPIYTFEVKNTFPHDPQAFTQGLIPTEGGFYESTGLYGRSSLRKVELKTGKVLQKREVPAKFFAEGMTLFQGKIYQLTWQEHKCLVYDPKTFQKQGEFSYTGEGWGLTHDEKLLIMSDGTHILRFIDPATFQVKRTIAVMNPADGKSLSALNELEFVKGEIYANVWQTDDIARIDPQSGKVLAWIDLANLYPHAERAAAPGAEKPDVLNGIAYDADKDRLFVTGKLWPNLYEITLKKQ